MSLEVMVEKAQTIAQRIFDESGELLPMWHVETAAGENMILSTPLGNGDEKELLTQALKVFFKQNNVVRYVFMAEVWFKTMKIDEPRFTGEVRLQTDRKEAVMLTGEDRDTGASIMVQFEIDRSSGKPVLLPPFKFDGPSQGRFTNMFVHETQQ